MIAEKQLDKDPEFNAMLERVQEFVIAMVMEFQKDRPKSKVEAWMRIGLMESYFRAWMDQCTQKEAIRGLFKGTCK